MTSFNVNGLNTDVPKHVNKIIMQDNLPAFITDVHMTKGKLEIFNNLAEKTNKMLIAKVTTKCTKIGGQLIIYF